MPKLVTQDEFIARCRKRHGDKYDYSRTLYVAAKAKIIVGCPDHGWFETIANNHASKNGCPQCGVLRSEAAKWSSKEEFIERARNIHGIKYDYSNVTYLGSQMCVTILCVQHGSFLQSPSNHLLGKGCPKCGAIRGGEKMRAKGLSGDEYFRLCSITHNGFYQYPEQNFKGMRSKITAVCPMHGSFHIDASPHLRLKTGCQTCGHEKASESKQKDVDEWIVDARRAHGDRYEYDATGWVGSSSTIRIRCKKHGWWQQQALKHYPQGQACPQCAHERLSGRWQPDTMTAEHAAERCYFYYMHLTSNDESFYKVGISNDVNNRSRKIRQVGYNIRIVWTISDNRKACLELEIATFKEFDDIAAYTPKIPFAGDGECFAWDILQMDL